MHKTEIELLEHRAHLMKSIQWGPFSLDMLDPSSISDPFARSLVIELIGVEAKLKKYKLLRDEVKVMLMEALKHGISEYRIQPEDVFIDIKIDDVGSDEAFLEALVYKLSESYVSYKGLKMPSEVLFIKDSEFMRFCFRFKEVAYMMD